MWGVLAELEDAGLVTLADKGYQGARTRSITRMERLILAGRRVASSHPPMDDGGRQVLLTDSGNPAW